MVTRRSLLAAAAGFASATPLLAACGSSKSSSSGSKTITAMAPLIQAEAPADDNALTVALNDYIGKQLKVNWVANASYTDKISVIMASGDMPQLVVNPSITSAFIRAAEAGAFWDLTKLLGSYPNLAPESAQTMKNASINGKQYGLYRERDIIRSCVVLRKDWLTKLGLQPPTNVNEFYNIAKAFKQANLGGLDGNCGMILPYWSTSFWASSPLDTMATWFGTPNQWGIVDGKIVSSFETDAFMDSQRFLRKMISEGLVNADFGTLSIDKINAQFVNGRGGILVDTQSAVVAITKLLRAKDANNYGDCITATGNLAGPDGTKRSYPTPGFAGVVGFSKSGIKSESELKAMLKIMDHLSEKQGQVLMNNGLEGKNFTVKNNLAVAVTPETTETKLITSAATAYAQLYTHGPKRLYYQAIAEGAPESAWLTRRLELQAEDLKTAVYNPLAGLQSKTYIEKGNTLLKTLSDDVIRYLAGQLTENDLKESIARWNSSGGTTIKKELAELQQKNG